VAVRDADGSERTVVLKKGDTYVVPKGVEHKPSSPGGSILISPLSSRTPAMIYMVGIQFRIPHNPSTPCPRFIC